MNDKQNEVDEREGKKSKATVSPSSSSTFSIYFIVFVLLFSLYFCSDVVFSLRDCVRTDTLVVCATRKGKRRKWKKSRGGKCCSLFYLFVLEALPSLIYCECLFFSFSLLYLSLFSRGSAMKFKKKKENDGKAGEGGDDEGRRLRYHSTGHFLPETCGSWARTKCE